ncbi:MAG: alpha/beta hydrolase [Saprospiraceae bacterium]|jgi:esterase/lipase superfamily enzyme|nr:alpha/beta hydrolase [Saprospiraceae bacterium]MBP9193397.1 alpha/beta hydrolase [Saprospiraceae bacterium]
MKLIKNTLIPTSHFYIHLLKDGKSLKYGRYGIGSGSLLPDQLYADFHEFAIHFSAIHNESSQVLIYIHGFMADFEIFEQKAGFILQNQIFNPLFDKYPVVISLKWETSPDYRSSVLTGENTGSAFYEVLYSLLIHQRLAHVNLKWSFLCHSMGNRIFSGIAKADQAKLIKLKYGTICMMAADVSSSIFEDELDWLPMVAERIIVFVNKKDRTLEIANWLVTYPRLGKTGPVVPHQNVFVIDATPINDHEGIVPKISKHRYYYASASIRSLLCSLLMGKENVSLCGIQYEVPILK